MTDHMLEIIEALTWRIESPVVPGIVQGFKRKMLDLAIALAGEQLLPLDDRREEALLAPEITRCLLDRNASKLLGLFREYDSRQHEDCAGSPVPGGEVVGGRKNKAFGPKAPLVGGSIPILFSNSLSMPPRLPNARGCQPEFFCNEARLIAARISTTSLPTTLTATAMSFRSAGIIARSRMPSAPSRQSRVQRASG